MKYTAYPQNIIPFERNSINDIDKIIYKEHEDDGRGVFIVEGSRYLQSFHDESYNIYIDDAIHYQICTDNDVVDIIANKNVKPVLNRLDINSYENNKI